MSRKRAETLPESLTHTTLPVSNTYSILVDMAHRWSPDPDDILAAKLDASARKLAFDDATPSDAASELLAIAGDRLDILS